MPLATLGKGVAWESLLRFGEKTSPQLIGNRKTLAAEPGAILSDFDVIMFFGRLRLRRKEGITRIP